MATAFRRHSIVNPARRNKARKNRARTNKRRHNMSAKQIKFFGTARQRAALKAKRRNAAKALAAFNFMLTLVAVAI